MHPIQVFPIFTQSENWSLSYRKLKTKYSKTWLIQNFSLNLCPKEEKFIHIYLII
jgi:hypothetical protein